MAKHAAPAHPKVGSGKALRLADGSLHRGKVFDRDGHELQLAKRTRPAPTWLAARNAVVRRVSTERRVTLPEASAIVKREGLWTR